MTVASDCSPARLVCPATLAGFTAARRMHPAAVICSGGTLVIPESHRLSRPPPIIDVRGIPELSVAGPATRGAATCLAALAADPGVPPALRAAAASVGSPAIRNAATIGGNIAAGSPGSVCVALLALRGRARVLGPDGRLGARPVEEVAGSAAGLIVSVTWDAARIASFAQVRVGAAGTVAAVVAVSADRAGMDWTVAVAGEPGPRRAAAVEAWLNAGQRPDRRTIAAAVCRSGAIACPDHALVSAALIRRGVTEVSGRAGDGPN
jgi:CO/xanthine dehydrogenase FAD-binding subunit